MGVGVGGLMLVLVQGPNMPLLFCLMGTGVATARPPALAQTDVEGARSGSRMATDASFYTVAPGAQEDLYPRRDAKVTRHWIPVPRGWGLKLDPGAIWMQL